jgi:hypothetical protein
LQLGNSLTLLHPERALDDESRSSMANMLISTFLGLHHQLNHQGWI